MRSWMSLQAGFGDFQYRRNVYLFALRMSFVAVILSGVILTLTIPPLGFFGLLPMTLSHAIGFGAVFSGLSAAQFAACCRWPLGLPCMS
ncbi:UNVERIFIED_ORG: apolipoprotein N-acyltransferase [Rhizobium esperanzae]